MSGSNYGRLPIFKDDLSFQDRHEQAFHDMRQRLDDDFGGGQLFGSNQAASRQPGFGRGWDWEEDLDRLGRDFYQLKPRPPRMGELTRDEFGSRESLDDNSTKNNYVENPQTKSRMFHMSFDVKDYSANELSVKVDGDALAVEARHEEDNGGHKNVREFNRRIKVPADVDIEKLTSTLSKDGILTIQAPVPPKYTNVAYITRDPHNNGASPHRPSATAAPSSLESTHTRYPYTASSISSQPLDTQRRMPTVSQPPLVPPPQTLRQPQPPPPSSWQQQQQQPLPSVAPQPPPASSWQQQQPPPSAVPQPASPTATSPPPLFQAAPDLPSSMDTPIFKPCADGSGDREMELALEVAAPFAPEDVVVKLEGRALLVEATHEEKTDGKSSKLSLSRNFDMTEDLDPGSVEAMLRSDGCLLIKGKVRKNAT